MCEEMTLMEDPRGCTEPRGEEKAKNFIEINGLLLEIIIWAVREFKRVFELGVEL